jgi:hypothetical protein
MLDAVFVAGATLATLDAVIRRNDPWAGVWRRRLALKSAAVGHGRPEDALRDAVALCKHDGDPGPAGRAYLAWRMLAEPARPWPEIAVGLGVSREIGEAVASSFNTHAKSPAPIAAAAAATALHAAFPRCGALAIAVADAVLAARLHWPSTLPLLAPYIGRAKPGEAGWDAACCAAYARAAAAACDLHGDLARAAGQLIALGPKLRAKAAAAVVAALLEDDVLTSATPIPGITDRGLRRMFDRLVALKAIRELSGRTTFRLYGL